MAWWYQVNFIEHDTSEGKQDSYDILLNGGYSATNAEEIMSTFTETLAHPNPTEQMLDRLDLVAKNYPFYLEAVLKERQPVSDSARTLLEDHGFL